MPASICHMHIRPWISNALMRYHDWTGDGFNTRIDPEMEQIADSARFEHDMHARRNGRFITIHSWAAGCENCNS